MPANRANIGWYLDNMIAAPAAEIVVHTIFKTEDGVLLCYGAVAPTVLEAQANVYAPCCMYFDVAGAGLFGIAIYINEGTSAVPSFNIMSQT